MLSHLFIYASPCLANIIEVTSRFDIVKCSTYIVLNTIHGFRPDVEVFNSFLFEFEHFCRKESKLFLFFSFFMTSFLHHFLKKLFCCSSFFFLLCQSLIVHILRYCLWTLFCFIVLRACQYYFDNYDLKLSFEIGKRETFHFSLVLFGYQHGRIITPDKFQ